MEQGTFAGSLVETPAPAGLCECGCGEPAPIARKNDQARGIAKGQPLRFIQGHYAKFKSAQVAAQILAAQESPDAKLCECGCGEPAPIAKRTVTSCGWTKGRPMRFVRGHHLRVNRKPRRKDAWLVNMVKLCECGCGQPTSIARADDKRRGQIKGQPVRFIRGHSSPVEAAERAARLYPEGVPSGVALCECGCGLPAPIALSDDPRRGYVKGQPRRFVAGHYNKVMSVEMGERFGRGVVVEAVRIPRQGRTGGVISGARLRCDCGNEYVQTVYVLRKGSVKSCGCLLRSKGGYTPELVAMNIVVGNYRASARDRGIPWELDDEDFRRLIVMDCAYCGARGERRSRSKGNNLLYNGIDRIDSSGPYRLGNVVPACQQCNFSKRDNSLDEWMAWAARFFAFQFFGSGALSARLLAAQLKDCQPKAA